MSSPAPHSAPIKRADRVANEPVGIFGLWHGAIWHRPHELYGEFGRHARRSPQEYRDYARSQPAGLGRGWPCAGQSWQLQLAAGAPAEHTAAVQCAGAGRCRIRTTTPGRRTGRGRATSAGSDYRADACPATADPARAANAASSPRQPAPGSAAAASASAAARAGSRRDASPLARARYACQFGRAVRSGACRRDSCN